MTVYTCYRFNVCVSALPPLLQPINRLKPTPKGMVLGGRTLESLLGHEGGALMNGISALTKETSESNPVPSSL